MLQISLKLIQIPCEVDGSSKNDQGKFPARMSSALVAGKPMNLQTAFNSSTDEITSDFSFEYFNRIEDLLLLESGRQLNVVNYNKQQTVNLVR